MDDPQIPLLTSDEPRRPEHRPTLSALSVASIKIIRVPKVHSSDTIVFLLCGIILVASTSSGFASIPFTRIVEHILCRQYYDQVNVDGGPIDEKFCKTESIQSKMAFIFAIAGMLDSVVEFFAAFPWGIAADRFGRKPVFALGLIGLTLNLIWAVLVLWFDKIFPVQLMWLGSVCLLLGGGNAVLPAVLLTMVSDVVPEEKRAVAFLRTHVASLVGNLMSPTLASLMMQITGPWPTLMVAVVCLLSAAIAFLFIPETSKYEDSHTDEGLDQPASFKVHLQHSFSHLKESLSILKNPSLILLLLTALGSFPITQAVLQFMVQFVSKRYNIAIKYTGYIQTIYGVAQTLQALVVIPWISRWLLKDSTLSPFHMTNEHIRDLTLARWSFGIIAVGALILGVAPSLGLFVFGLIVLAVGSAYNSLTRSLMTLYIDPEHRSRLFSVVGMIEVVGAFYSRPMLAGLFSLGMKLGGGWIGMPYYALAIFCATMVVILLFVRLPKQDEYVHED
ncbi:major facilitator superfamily transporter [Pseudomassariella vexata]|uniref:Major facilitator superfamily transporter n=1 Tax=Pseudomassariella vexata TaxID=1141098 RepID=A0A1Y2DD74_9PEZI|nr:major facilitator superfamily transporter [Pseudomassariella vexata]ORY57232.1 major facilitator superfamily transporter [Pseudomassariella vexata]